MLLVSHSFAWPQHINSCKKLFTRTHSASLKICIEKRCNNQIMITFINSGSETRIYKIFSDNKPDGW